MNAVKRYFTRCFEISHGKHTGLPGMEGLRGFAVFLVFLTHYFSLSEPWLTQDSIAHFVGHSLWRIGNTGVDLFFVLSGYMIYGMLIAKPRPMIPYFRRRIERIYPTFLVVLFIYVALSMAVPNKSLLPAEMWGAAVYLAQNLLMLPGLFQIKPIITVAWSLSYEFFYYLVIPFLIIALRMRSWPRYARIVFFAIIAIGIFAYALTFQHHVRLMMFVAGILLFESPTFRAAGLIDRIGLVAPLAVFLAINGSDDGGGLWRYVWLFFAFYLLCYAVFREERFTYRIFTWTPLRWLGNMSYSYYLIHGLTLNVAFVALAKLFPPSGQAPWIYWVAMVPMFAFTLIPSTILFLAIERPYSIQPRLQSPRPRNNPIAAEFATQRGFVGNAIHADDVSPRKNHLEE